MNTMNDYHSLLSDFNDNEMVLKFTKMQVPITAEENLLSNLNRINRKLTYDKNNDDLIEEVYNVITTLSETPPREKYAEKIENAIDVFYDIINDVDEMEYESDSSGYDYDYDYSHDTTEVPNFSLRTVTSNVTDRLGVALIKLGNRLISNT